VQVHGRWSDASELLLEKLVYQAGGIRGARSAEDCPFAGRFCRRFGVDFRGGQSERLRESVGLDRDSRGLLPSVSKFTAFVKMTTAPKGRLAPGIWALRQA